MQLNTKSLNAQTSRSWRVWVARAACRSATRRRSTASSLPSARTPHTPSGLVEQVIAASQGRLVSEQRRVGVGQGPLTILHEAQELLLSPLHGLELEWATQPEG